MDAPILVTGGAGFLGSHVVRRLLDLGQPVRVLDVPQVGPTSLHGNLEYVAGDIRDRAAVARAVRGCRAVCHVAGLAQLWRRPRGRFQQVNGQGAVHVLDEAVAAGCQRIVHVSSATVWPLQGADCSWRDALGPYCRSKLWAERHALRLARRGAPIVVVSPTLPIGPGDWSRTPPTQLLVDFCQGKRHEYLAMRLNLIDVRDLADAMIRALEDGEPGQRYWLGHATVSLLELFAKLAALTGLPAPRWRVPYPLALLAALASEWWAEVVSGQTPLASVAGVRLARRPLPSAPAPDVTRLGITPRPLEQTLADVLGWFRKVGWVK
jgi:dihydroflavonol-4-reductase